MDQNTILQAEFYVLYYILKTGPFSFFITFASVTAW